MVQSQEDVLKEIMITDKYILPIAVLYIDNGLKVYLSMLALLFKYHHSFEVSRLVKLTRSENLLLQCDCL